MKFNWFRGLIFAVSYLVLTGLTFVFFYYPCRGQVTYPSECFSVIVWTLAPELLVLFFSPESSSVTRLPAYGGFWNVYFVIQIVHVVLFFILGGLMRLSKKTKL